MKFSYSVIESIHFLALAVPALIPKSAPEPKT
jgi:hypothetical protein